jgi:hypothetical protein
MKPRPTRHDVSLDARIQDELGPRDACVVNASARGLALHSATPPLPGSYIELHTGRHVIVARVVWVLEHYFGVQTQGGVPDDLLPEWARSSLQMSSVPVAVNVIGFTPPADLFDRSRSAAKTLQFVGIVVLSVAAASLAFTSIEMALARPLALVRSALTTH